jgi:hypothetical protein
MPWTVARPSPVPWPNSLVVKNGSNTALAAIERILVDLAEVREKARRSAAWA